MVSSVIAIHLSCAALAILLFFIVNWIGEHAASFGYSSTTLFANPEESLALNFVVRTLPPAVFMVLLSAIAVATDNSGLRLQIYWIAIYYYLLRAVYFILAGIHRLINWRRYLLHAAIGLTAAWMAYIYLVLPENSLLPNLETAGNELWLAMLIFVYTVGNNVFIADPKAARRRNSFVKSGLDMAVHRYGRLIGDQASDDLLKLIVYSVIVYEDYCRPAVVRKIERAWFWHNDRTTGIMQVRSDRALTDYESVELGTEILKKSWLCHVRHEPWQRVWRTIADYNRDDRYIRNVMEIMEVIAKHADRIYIDAYDSMFSNPWPAPKSNHKDRPLCTRRTTSSQMQTPRQRSLMYRRARRLPRS